MSRPHFVLSANATAQEGGQGLNLQHMMEGLEEDFQLSVFARGPENGLIHQIKPSRLSAVLGAVPRLRRRRDWVTLASDLQFDRAVARLLPPSDYFQGVVGQCAESLRKASKNGAKTILDAVNTHVADFGAHVSRESKRFGLKSFIHPKMHQRILEEYQHADVIRVMSNRAKATFLREGVDDRKLFVAMPPMDVDSFPQATFRGETFSICFVGLLEPWKGFHYLLEAYRKLTIAPRELVLWGGPGSRAASQLLGQYQRSDSSIRVRSMAIRARGLSEVYGRASVLVHPSLSEGFSYAVAEAMASGLPVIVTDNTGAADLVRDGENGYIIPGGDVSAIYERLEHLGRNPALLSEMGSRARASVRALTLPAFQTALRNGLARLG